MRVYDNQEALRTNNIILGDDNNERKSDNA